MNVTLNLNWKTGELVRLQCGNIVEVAAEKIVRGFRSQQVQLSLKLMIFFCARMKLRMTCMEGEQR